MGVLRTETICDARHQVAIQREGLRSMVRELLHKRFESHVTLFHAVELALLVATIGRCHLTLQDLSFHFSLSTSSIRRVISRLQTVKVLEVRRVCSESGAQLANEYCIPDPVIKAAENHFELQVKKKSVSKVFLKKKISRAPCKDALGVRPKLLTPDK